MIAQSQLRHFFVSFWLLDSQAEICRRCSNTISIPDFNRNVWFPCVNPIRGAISEILVIVESSATGTIMALRGLVRNCADVSGQRVECDSYVAKPATDSRLIGALDYRIASAEPAISCEKLADRQTERPPNLLMPCRPAMYASDYSTPSQRINVTSSQTFPPL